MFGDKKHLWKSIIHANKFSEIEIKKQMLHFLTSFSKIILQPNTIILLRYNKQTVFISKRMKEFESTVHLR